MLNGKARDRSWITDKWKLKRRPGFDPDAADSPINAEIVRLAQTGISRSAIARRINTKFKTAMTASAVTGRLLRADQRAG